MNWITSSGMDTKVNHIEHLFGGAFLLPKRR
jgi:hypothetical protein